MPRSDRREVVEAVATVDGGISSLSVMKHEQLLMLESLDAIWREVSQHDSILIATHERPDGDALGSLAAVHCVLVREGHTVQMASIETVPPGYDFMLPMLKNADRTGVPSGRNHRRYRTFPIRKNVSWHSQSGSQSGGTWHLYK